MLLDSNILIGYLNGDTTLVEQMHEWRKEYRLILISAINYAEVLSYPHLKAREIERVKKFLDSFIVIPFNDELAELTATIRRNHNIPFMDACIGATAIKYQVPLEPISKFHSGSKMSFSCYDSIQDSSKYLGIPPRPSWFSLGKVLFSPQKRILR